MTAAPSISAISPALSFHSPARIAFYLFGVSCANDRARDCRMPQHPGDGHFAWPAAMARAHLAEPLDQFEVLGKTRLLEFLIAASEVIGRQLGCAFAGHRAGEQSGSHGGVSNHADTSLLAVRKDFLFNLAANQRIRRLQRG